MKVSTSTRDLCEGDGIPIPARTASDDEDDEDEVGCMKRYDWEALL